MLRIRDALWLPLRLLQRILRKSSLDRRRSRIYYATHSIMQQRVFAADERGGVMDAQMKRGFLEACVLAVLSRGESYGYQITKDARPSLGLTESAAQATGRRELHCRALCRAQWAAAQVLSHHNRGPRSRGDLHRGMERGGGHLPLRARGRGRRCTCDGRARRRCDRSCRCAC